MFPTCGIYPIKNGSTNPIARNNAAKVTFFVVSLINVFLPLERLF